MVSRHEAFVYNPKKQSNILPTNSVYASSNGVYIYAHIPTWTQEKYFEQKGATVFLWYEQNLSPGVMGTQSPAEIT